MEAESSSLNSISNKEDPQDIKPTTFIKVETQDCYYESQLDSSVKEDIDIKEESLHDANDSEYDLQECHDMDIKDEFANSFYQTNSTENLQSTQIDEIRAEKQLPNEPTVSPNRKARKRRHICDVCEKTFGSPADLRRHITIHTGLKSYVCEECNKAFNREHNLIRHKLVHTGQKPYVCDTCNKAFTSQYNLRKHKTTKSTQSYTQKSFVCNICGRSFQKKYNWLKHVCPYASVKQPIRK